VPAAMGGFVVDVSVVEVILCRVVDLVIILTEKYPIHKYYN